MQPCFAKLWAFMQDNGACKEACLTVQASAKILLNEAAQKDIDYRDLV